MFETKSVLQLVFKVGTSLPSFSCDCIDIYLHYKLVNYYWPTLEHRGINLTYLNKSESCNLLLDQHVFVCLILDGKATVIFMKVFW